MTASLLALLLQSGSASATELTWDGFYRGRALAYDSLSLSSTNASTEGFSGSFDHRMSLRPAWLLSEHASLHAQVDLFPFQLWGAEPATYVDPVTGEETAIATADGTATSGAGLVATRAWAEAYTPIGRFALGRMPMQWGAGILWNDGNDPEDEYGDTADRLMFSTRVGPVFVFGAYDVQFEGDVGFEDDMQSASLGIGYRSETAGVGLLNNYRYQTSKQYKAYTGDIWAFTELGPVRAELEVVGVVGGGDLETGATGVDILAFGGMLNAAYSTDKLTLGIEGGFATGDADPADSSIRTFSFDRDHNVALVLFEETLPTLQAAVPNDSNQGRNTDAALLGDGLSNVLYLRPAVKYHLLPEVEAELSWFTGTMAAGPDTTDGRKGYGNEIDLSLRYDPHPHVWVKGSAGILLPGKYFTEYEDPDLGRGFEKASWGARLIGTVEF
ncbi:MAG: hypothetical protein Q8P41_16860 [Pseudomonadota bacterium]|nr:hypothetical protein [Pseudomonadota bacterium]